MLKPSATEAYLITKVENKRYLTDFDGAGFVMVMRNEILLATDQRYWLRAKAVKKRGMKLFDMSGSWPVKLQEQMKKVKTVYYDEHHLTVAGLGRWKKLLPKKIWKKSEGAVEDMRLYKAPEELDKLRMAAALGDKVLRKVIPALKPGVTEKTIANMLRAYSNELADGVSFDPIVAFGQNGAVPHHRSGQTKLQKNDAILIDQGVKHAGYMSDMTRCMFIGKGIPKVREMYDLLHKVQKAGVNMVRPGIHIDELCTAIRAMLGKEDKYFTHSLGHGVGLEVHEAPGVSNRSKTILVPGMVITIEPGLYKEGIGGVRIEDTVIVTEDGCEVITKHPKGKWL